MKTTATHHNVKENFTRSSNMIKEYLKNFMKKYRVAVITLFELSSVVIAYLFSFLIRFDFSIPNDQLEIFFETLPFLIISRMATYYYYKIHSSLWRYVSMRDLIEIFKAILTGSTLFLFLVVFIFNLKSFPRSVFILEILTSLILIGGTKFMIRYFREYKRENHYKKTNTLILGAGKAGVLVINEIRTNPNLGINVVGFVDDDPQKWGMRIQGIPILGSIKDIPEIAKTYAVDEIIIAIASIGYKNIVEIMKVAHSVNLKTKLLPSLEKLILCNSFKGLLQDVCCDDLLGRSEIKFKRESDLNLLLKDVKGKSVLVTGAGGSIGSELCRQIAMLKPSILIMYDRYETSLHDLEIEIRKEFPKQHILPIIGDILDSKQMDEVLKVNKVDLIYHAAAYKHVPIMERNPLEAVQNNVIGTMNVAKCAIKNNVKKFVLISTDKAVNPLSIMGTTKRIAELIVQELNGNSTKFISVRFGNVIGSNGSVIPIFKKQIAEGGPVTVTHPDVSRYFMSISEAVQLVLISGGMGDGGEIFLLDMGKPVNIVDLAKELITRSGMEPVKDVDIVFTGLRPGEKLAEELYWKGEGIVSTENKKITMLKTNGLNSKNILSKIDILKEYISKRDTYGIVRLMQEIVPEAKIVNRE